MTTSLDDILGGGAVPEDKPVEVTQPVAAETPEQETEPHEGVEETLDGKKMVPLKALTEERGKGKRYTEQVAEFDKTVSGLREQNANLARQVTELMQRIPVPKQEAPPAPTDFFTDPDTAFHERLQAGLAPALGPVQQQLMAQAEMLAGLKYGDEKVTEAEKAFITALQSRQVDPMDYRRVVDSPNRYAAAVQWHARQVAQAEIGDDPAAFKAKVEAELREKIEAELQGTQPTQVQPRQQAVMPTAGFANTRSVGGSRDGPKWAGPQSIGSIFSNNR